MANFSRIQVVQSMQDSGIVPVFYHSDVTIAKEALSACYRGGARLFEFTNRGDFAHEVFRELSLFARKELPEMILGVGSITDAATASLYMQMGANFIVTPAFRRDIALVCNRRKVLWSPGCGSLTEICEAEELGCEVVKLFPGGVYGPGFVKDIKGPQPWTSIMPTGGVSPTRESLEAWFKAGVSCVGMGSQLMVKDKNGVPDYARIEQLTHDAIKMIKEIRG
ncbi:MAG: bifunctional 4-hydroxy-2-oxoglutarate aldolase/2-dehydro-3-deoxy-phosphogluconate aldolase [Lewinella sp.]|jgi:2-dehydro-3-deoxyphosphogluconate aldolase/(4S)-4-hydroxy-2-oxoglutarate aldolase|uniref:bifunctional 4-hydroxy-2-oxoglutarate aldolase/2-dehydro-3-deoxy-phosphogluconate aldolase n=1 Tax=Lewinella sp. TaxID=2004506 RepID=UPI003D6AF3DB